MTQTPWRRRVIVIGEIALVHFAVFLASFAYFFQHVEGLGGTPRWTLDVANVIMLVLGFPTLLPLHLVPSNNAMYPVLVVNSVVWALVLCGAWSAARRLRPVASR